jgi:hypothetical protein
MKSRKLTRLEAVQEQLNSAIRLYFLWDDLVSAVTLAGAAERVLSDFQPADGIFGVDARSIRSVINLYIKTEHQKEAAIRFRADYDFFRHADRQQKNEYELVEERVDSLLFLSIGSFEFIRKPITREMRIFVWWFMMKNPHFFKQEHDQTKLAIEVGKKIKGISKRDCYLGMLQLYNQR